MKSLKRLPIAPVREDVLGRQIGIDTNLAETIDPNTIPCFARHTMIATDQDELRVQELNYGDRVLVPDQGFDKVVGVIQIPAYRSMQTILNCYGPRSVGNYARLVLSPACRVYERSRDRDADLVELSRDVAVNFEVAGQNIQSSQLYCIVLEKERMLIANGAFVTAANPDSLTHSEAHLGAQSVMCPQSLLPRRL